MGHVVWVLLPVFGGAHVLTTISVDCYLKKKNGDIITIPQPTPETQGQKEFVPQKSSKYLPTPGPRIQQMPLVSGADGGGFNVCLVGRETNLS